MEKAYTRSFVVMGQLAWKANRTPPCAADSQTIYLDGSVIKLGRTRDTYDQRLWDDFLSQRGFAIWKNKWTNAS